MRSHAREGDGKGGLPAFAHEVVEVGGECDGFVSPVGKTEEGSDADSSKASCVGSFRAVEAPEKVLFGSCGVEGFVGWAVVSFLVDDESFGAVGDEFGVLVVFHGADFNSDGREEESESVDALLEVSIGNKLGVFACNEEDISESQRVEVLGFGYNLGNGEGGAKDGVVSGKSAVLAVINAFIGEVKGGEEAHRLAKVLVGEGLALLGHGFQLRSRAGGEELDESLHFGSGRLQKRFELEGKAHGLGVGCGVGIVKGKGGLEWVLAIGKYVVVPTCHKRFCFENGYKGQERRF